jgi:hypothetical protein
MRKAIVVTLISGCVVASVGFGWFLYFTRDARRIDSAQVFVTFYKTRPYCTVSLGLSGKPNALPCADVFAYIHDQLKLAPGGTFVTADLGNTHASEISGLILALENSVYKSLGRRAVFITEPQDVR